MSGPKALGYGMRDVPIPTREVGLKVANRDSQRILGCLVSFGPASQDGLNIVRVSRR